MHFQIMSILDQDTCTLIRLGISHVGAKAISQANADAYLSPDFREVDSSGEYQ